ncbi:hypothetical protein RN001_016368 [Aquatica leii]|uniref:Uncharacterized protein n=1 Tax=Aquatica leii TaxID=1421715 RepID=A0AAN7NXU4_9COLE|nr:hypothetical protein RN001_016368 [Aquatica leii]
MLKWQERHNDFYSGIKRFRKVWPYLYTNSVNRLFEPFFFVGVDKDWFKLDYQEVQLSQCLQLNEILEEATAHIAYIVLGYKQIV